MARNQEDETDLREAKMIIGILGGIGSGKSTVARMLSEMGAEVLDADAMAHEVLETPRVREEITGWLGKSVLRPDGSVDRSLVARRVFDDRASLMRLEAMVHPEVVRRIERRIVEHRQDTSGERALVLDVPLLLSAGLRDQCDVILDVEAPIEVRKARAASRGWDAEEIERREHFQPSSEERMRHADFVIFNADTLDGTRRQVEECHAKMRESVSRKRAGKGQAVDAAGAG